jgi:hypothetical protein
VKQLLVGADPARAVSRYYLSNPGALDLFVEQSSSVGHVM